MSRTVFHALTYNSSVPQTSEQQKKTQNKKGDTPKEKQSIENYQKFRGSHDPEWTEAQSHPIKLYEFYGLNVEGLEKYLGEPPKREVKTARQMKEEFRKKDQEATAGMMAALEGVVEKSRR